MKKMTVLRFTALVGLLAILAWMPAGTAEAAPCSYFAGQRCTTWGLTVYCEVGVETIQCTCGWDLRWDCPPV